jgi:hypothetical protein
MNTMGNICGRKEMTNSDLLQIHVRVFGNSEFVCEIHSAAGREWNDSNEGLKLKTIE